jgi:hypothetical protein
LETGFGSLEQHFGLRHMLRMAVSTKSVMVFCFLRPCAGVATERFPLRERRMDRRRAWFWRIDPAAPVSQDRSFLTVRQSRVLERALQPVCFVDLELVAENVRRTDYADIRRTGASTTFARDCWVSLGVPNPKIQRKKPGFFGASHYLNVAHRCLPTLTSRWGNGPLPGASRSLASAL